MSSPRDELAQRRKLLYGIMLAVAVWGGLLSLGAFLFGVDPQSNKIVFSPSLFRGLIPAICVSLFIGGWALLLRRRRTE